MNIFGQIEKLITEHGSASILRDHVNLLKEHFALLEKQNASLKEDNKSLNSKLDACQSNLNQANSEIAQLNKLVDSFQAQRDSPQIDTTSEQILLLLFQMGGEMEVRQIASSMSLDIATTEHHIDVLMENDMITQIRSDFEPFSENNVTYSFYYLTSEGRAYVVRNLKT